MYQTALREHFQKLSVLTYIFHLKIIMPSWVEKKKTNIMQGVRKSFV